MYIYCSYYYSKGDRHCGFLTVLSTLVYFAQRRQPQQKTPITFTDYTIFVHQKVKLITTGHQIMIFKEKVTFRKDNFKNRVSILLLHDHWTTD